MKPRKMSLRRVPHVGEIINACTILFKKLEGGRPLGGLGVDGSIILKRIVSK
jgi:hypothetical protein